MIRRVILSRTEKFAQLIGYKVIPAWTGVTGFKTLVVPTSFAFLSFPYLAFFWSSCFRHSPDLVAVLCLFTSLLSLHPFPIRYLHYFIFAGAKPSI